MDLSKVRFSKLFFTSLGVILSLSLGAWLIYILDLISFDALLGAMISFWIQITILLSKTYFLSSRWRHNPKPGLLITVISFFLQAGILVYHSFFQMNLPFLIGFLIANYFTMKIFVSTAYILLKYESKNA